MIRSFIHKGLPAACGIALAALGCERRDVARVPSDRLMVERPVADIRLPPISTLTSTASIEKRNWIVRRGDDCFIEFEAQWPDVESKHPFLDVSIEGVYEKDDPHVLGTTVLYPKRMKDGCWVYRGDPIVFRRLGKYRVKITNRRIRPPATLYIGFIEFVDRPVSQSGK
jgi:hypothetical protein